MGKCPAVLGAECSEFWGFWRFFNYREGGLHSRIVCSSYSVECMCSMGWICREKREERARKKDVGLLRRTRAYRRSVNTGRWQLWPAPAL